MGGRRGKPRTKTLRWDELDTFLGWRSVPSEWSGGGEKLKLTKKGGRGGDWEAKERT